MHRNSKLDKSHCQVLLPSWLRSKAGLFFGPAEKRVYLRRQYAFRSPQSYLNVLGSNPALGSALAPVRHPAPGAQLILGFLQEQKGSSNYHDQTLLLRSKVRITKVEHCEAVSEYLVMCCGPTCRGAVPLWVHKIAFCALLY